MAEHNKLGEEGEKIAVNYLKNKGYLVYHTNWRLGHLEIDIIAEDKNELVFIEVKFRSTKHYGAPWQAVNGGKQHRLIKAAHHYINKVKWDGEARFDVISIVGSTAAAEIQHIEGAYYPRV